MKKKLLWLVPLLLLLNSFLLIIILVKKKEITFLKNNIVEYNEKRKETEYLFLKSATTKNIILDSKLPIISIVSDTLPISDIIDKVKLLFLFNKINCNICVSREVQLLNKHIKEFGVNNIIILAEVDYLRYLISFQKVNNLKIPVFCINSNLSNLLIGDLNKPFYCTIDSDLHISNIFIPNEKNPEVTTKYLELIKNLIVH